MKAEPQDLAEQQKQRQPLFRVVDLFADLCRLIDEGHTEPQAVAQILADVRLDIAASIDRRKALLRAVRGHKAAALAAKAEAEAQIRALDKVEQAVKASTQAIIESAPDLPYADSKGVKVYLSQSQPKLVLDLSLGGPKSVSNIVDLVEIKRHGIDAKFLAKASFLVLDTKEVRAALEAGVELPWARLERGRHLRGLTDKKDEE